jgi:phenylalanyl-tRNA synthetase beta chain
MVFSYNWLQSFFSRKLPVPAKLADLLAMHAFEVEEVKKVGGDSVLDIAVLPNRAPDCFSHLGIAREIAAILKSKLKIQKSKLIEDKILKADNFVSVEVKNSNACPRYNARVLVNVKVGPSPKWIQSKLIACGLRPINNIVDITNYVMLETGQPLHAFDASKIAGRKIIVRFAKNGEFIKSLDGVSYKLSSDILVIADDKKPIAIAGIKGGKSPEIDEDTKTIVVESANFSQVLIRKASQKLGLKTDASLRFEHGLDLNLTEVVINKVCFLINQVAKGKVAFGIIDVYPKKVLPRIVRLDLNYAESLLGTKVFKKEVILIMKQLGFELKKQKLDILDFEIPTIRRDIILQEDLIEEIGRIRGYEKIKSVLPIGSMIPPKRNLNIFWEDMAKNALKEAGLTEVYNYSFFGDKEASAFGLSQKDLIEIQNPVSEEQKYMRTTLIPGLLKNLERNINYLQDIRIFELGKVFKALKKPEEKRMLSGLMTGNNFYQLKGAVDMLLNRLGISDIWYDNFEPTPKDGKLDFWNKSRCAEIKIGGKEIGFLGEVSSKMIEKFNVKEKVVLFNIDFEVLSKLVSEEQEYRPISKFPSAIRDIAVLVPKQINMTEILNKIETVGGILVRDVDLFDVFEGSGLPAGKKNLAFHIIYQSEERTLSSQEIDELQSKIIKALEKNPEWQVRK